MGKYPLARFAYATVFSVLLAGCLKQKGVEYFPENGVGSRYEYSLDYQAPSGNVQHASMIERVDGEETISSKRYHKVVYTFIGVPGLDRQVDFLRWSPEGIYAVDGNHKDKPEYLQTPFPVVVGSSWVSQSPDSRDTYQAVGLETVDTSTETFRDCLKVSFKSDGQNGNTEGTAYLAPQIGAVRILTSASGVQMTFTLQRYKK